MATNKEQFLRKHDLPKDTSLSAEQMSELSGFPVAALLEVYKRGIGAWKTNPSSVRIKGTFKKDPNLGRYPRGARLTKEQWAAGRVYAFLNRSDKVFYGADDDVRREYGLR
jgi:hypothetical protein